MKKFILLLLVSIPLFSFNAHKFYLSVTDIRYDKQEESLEIITRVFIDDMEAAIGNSQAGFFLTRSKEHKSADWLVEKYLKERLEVSVDGCQKELNYLGKKYDRDQLVLYIEIEQVRPFETIEIRNSILTGNFPDQKNIVHVEMNKKTKSLLLTREEQRGLLKFHK